MAGKGTAHLQDPRAVLLRVENLVVEYQSAEGGRLHAVSELSFDVRTGETLGLVGESGCGKSSTGRAIMMLTRPASGAVIFDGKNLTALSPNELRRERAKLQMIFQDPISSLNPRRRVRELVKEGLNIHRHGKVAAAEIDEMLAAVGLDPEAVGMSRPRELSGGQCQRVAIARALILKPQLIVCDEPVSALDVSVQAQVLNLIESLKARYALTLVFIAHDLAVVRNVSDRIAVMYLGKLCEIAPSATLFAEARHPYTQALVSAIPVPDPAVPIPPYVLSGDLPSPANPPSGCRFRTRCPRAKALCAEEEPIVQQVEGNHFVACHYPARMQDMTSTRASALA